MSKIIYQGVLSGILAMAASGGYSILYQSFLGTDFNKVINYGSVAGASLLGCFLMSASYHLAVKKFNFKNATGWINLAFVAFSFVSIVGPFTITLPLDIDNPELFPGLAIPMHFFPVISFLAVLPFFKQEQRKYNY